MIFLILFYLFSLQEKNPALLFLESQIALEQNNYQKAEKFLKEAIKLNPADSFLKIELARVLIYSGKVMEAGDVLKNTSPSDNLKEDYYSLKFYIELMSGEIEKAVESYKNIENNSLSKENTLFIAQAIQANILKYFSEESPENSIKLMKIYLKIFPEDLNLKGALLDMLLEVKDFKGAEEIIKNLNFQEENYPLILKYLSYLFKENNCKRILEFEKNLPDKEKEDILQIYSYCYFVEGQPEKAIPLLSRVLTINPRNELALRLMLEIKMLEGDYKGAKAVLEIYPRDQEQQINYIREKESLIYQLEGEPIKAEEVLIKLLNKYESKERVKVLNKLYNFYKSTGDCLKVLQTAFEILKEEEDNTFNYYKIAEAYLISKDIDNARFYLKIYKENGGMENLIDSLWLLLDYGYLENSQDFFEELTNLKDQTPEKNQAIAFYYFNKGDIEKMEEILKRDPDDAHSLNLLGYLLIERDQKIDEAISYIQKAIEIQPYNGAFLDSLGWGYYKKGDLEKAYKYLRYANFLQPYSGTILSHLGEVSLKMGNYEEALLRFRQALYFQEPGMEDVLKKIEEILKNFRKTINF